MRISPATAFAIISALTAMSNAAPLLDRRGGWSPADLEAAGRLVARRNAQATATSTAVLAKRAAVAQTQDVASKTAGTEPLEENTDNLSGDDASSVCSGSSCTTSTTAPTVTSRGGDPDGGETNEQPNSPTSDASIASLENEIKELEEELSDDGNGTANMNDTQNANDSSEVQSQCSGSQCQSSGVCSTNDSACGNALQKRAMNENSDTPEDKGQDELQSKEDTAGDENGSACSANDSICSLDSSSCGSNSLCSTGSWSSCDTTGTACEVSSCTSSQASLCSADSYQTCSSGASQCSAEYDGALNLVNSDETSVEGATMTQNANGVNSYEGGVVSGPPTGEFSAASNAGDGIAGAVESSQYGGQ